MKILLKSAPATRPCDARLAGVKLRYLVVSIFCLALTASAQTSSYRYIRIGNNQDLSPKAIAGYALMGGGSDLDQAFRFLCQKGAGGDFLVVRAAGTDAYNSYINELCKVNSVATLVIPSRDAANDPHVAELIHHAEVVFIAGGDQARYINWWQHTSAQDALNAHLAAGKPIGGTSAGLAVLGEYIYSAQGDAPDDPDLTSAQALADPYMNRVTVRRDFLQIGLLRNTLTDSHFAKRDRMGRSLTFLARIVQDGWSANPREIAVDEKSAVLVEPDGKARVIGDGRGAYFMQVREKPSLCQAGVALGFHDVSVYHAQKGAQFDLKTWNGSGGTYYSLSVEHGVVINPQGGDKY
jgi:cyanophycinase